MSEFRLRNIFENEAVKNIGGALRRALRIGEDYRSLVELDYVETKEQFAEAIKKFLRRYESIDKRGYEGKELSRVVEGDLEEIMKLVDEYGVKTVRAALISYALAKKEKEGGG